MNTPKIDIIVTRHPHLITVLRERGLVGDATPVLTHVGDPAQIAGKHVIGVLPHHLSARAASITEIPMRWTEADRAAMSKGDVGLEGTRAAAGDPVTYFVSCGRDRATAAVGAAMAHSSGPNGYRVDFLINDKETIMEVSDHDGHASAQVDMYRGAIRHHLGTLDAAGWGPWRDPFTGERVAIYPTDMVDDLLSLA